MDQTLLNRLQANASLVALVGTRIFPVRPTGDTLLPYIVYSLNSTDDNPTLSNATSVVRYEYQIDYWSVNELQNNTIAGYITTQLNGWSNRPSVKGSFRQSKSQEPEEVGFHGRQTYAIMAP